MEKDIRKKVKTKKIKEENEKDKKKIIRKGNLGESKEK